jgi:hypothetical protein
MVTTVIPSAQEVEDVARGAALLDEKRPGWFSEINLADLSLDNASRCVLGQLFPEPVVLPRWQRWHYASREEAMSEAAYSGAYLDQLACISNFAAGVVLLDLSPVKAEIHGFNVRFGDNCKQLTTYAGLEVAWTQAVQRRQDEAACVARGAALLDEKLPGWHERIDLEILDLSETSVCVLGQLFEEPIKVPLWVRQRFSARADALTAGYPEEVADELVCDSNYFAGVYVLGLGQADAREYGFNVRVSEDYETYYTTYEGLDLAWGAEVQRRQSV